MPHLRFSGVTPPGQSGGVGGSTGAADNRLLRSDGVGGGTLQASAVTVDDSGNMTVGASAVGTVAARRAWIAPGEDFDVPAAFSGSGFTNDGVGAQIVFSLPAAALGLEFLFSVDAAFNLVLLANGTDVIYLGSSASSAGGTLSADAIGETVLLTCSKAGRWKAIAQGTWTPA